MYGCGQTMLQLGKYTLHFILVRYSSGLPQVGNPALRDAAACQPVHYFF